MNILANLSYFWGKVLYLWHGLWICNPPEEEGESFKGVLEVDRMEEQPVVEMEGKIEVVDAEFECRDW